MKNRAVVAQLVRVPACHAGGRGFEPRPPRHVFRFPRSQSAKFSLQPADHGHFLDGQERTFTPDHRCVPGAARACVQEVDVDDNTITLTDGAIYQLPFGMNADFYTRGQNVKIVSYVVGNTNIVTQVSFAS